MIDIIGQAVTYAGFIAFMVWGVGYLERHKAGSGWSGGSE